MQATTKQHKEEYFGIVKDDEGNILWQTATTSLDKINALQRAQKWIREKRTADAERAEKTLNRVRRHYKSKKQKKDFSVGDVVRTPLGAGLLQSYSQANAVVKVSGRMHTFAASQISKL